MWRNCSNIVTDLPARESADSPGLAGRRGSILRPLAKDEAADGGPTAVGEKIFACRPATAPGRARRSGFWGAPSGRRGGRAGARVAGGADATGGRARLSRARLGHQPTLDQAGKQSRAEGNGRVVEVIAVVVHRRAHFAVAEID